MARRGVFSVCMALVALLAAASVALTPRPAGAALPQQAQSPPPKAYIVVDVATGTVLAADHEHDALRPASTAKVMTALTAVERLAPDALVNVSPLAAAQPASRINMQAGQQWPLRDAIASLLLASANDAAYAIAESAGGSLDGFVAAMEDTARRLGMEDSTFADPAGLDDDTSFNDGPRMSAFDVAIATRNAIAVPELAAWGALRYHEFVDPTGLERSLTNHNKFLPGASRGYAFATGFKTGFTSRAGHTLTATATRDGRSLIAVIIDTYDTYGWAAQLLEQGFATPNGAGTGARLPDVAVSPYADRVAAQQAFLAVARGAPVTPTTSGAATTTVATTTTTTIAAASSDADPAAIAAPEPASDPSGDRGEEPGDDDSGGGWFDLRLGLVALVVAAVAAFFLRRRTVRRQRARRIAQQRLRAAKMRSGGLPVVDGRFGRQANGGAESHVRIRRIDEES
jgi:D-alanyl-D-alanine carboxypeptidase